MCTDGHPQMASPAEETAHGSHQHSCSGSTQGEGHPCYLCTRWKACLALSTWDPHILTPWCPLLSRTEYCLQDSQSPPARLLFLVPAVCRHPLLLSPAQGPGPHSKEKGEPRYPREVRMSPRYGPKTYTDTADTHKYSHTRRAHRHSLVSEEHSQRNGWQPWWWSLVYCPLTLLQGPWPPIYDSVMCC